MNRILSVLLFSSICINSIVWSQAKKTTVNNAQLSKAEKMGYARTNQYWGPGTYYCFAPGVTKMKMVNNSESAMRDLTGISKEDFLKEIAKQGFYEVPSKEVKKWFNDNNSKDKKFYYSADKSYILYPNIKDMYNSAKAGYMPYASASMTRYVLLPASDSLLVIEKAWQYLRDLYDMKIILSSFASTFKKANPKAFPIEMAGSTGWTSMRAGTFLLRNVDGKLQGVWDSNENIIRRTIGKPEFRLNIQGMETDFGYGLTIKLLKEGYVLEYLVVANTMADLEPGSNWTAKHKTDVEMMKKGESMDLQVIETYKKAPVPPVLENINKLLHIK